MTFFWRLVEWFLGVPPSDPGQGTRWRFSQNFPWPPWVLLLFALFAIVYVVLVYRRDAATISRSFRALLAGLRLAAVGMLLFFLSETVMSVERTGLPYMVVLLDVSGSMEVQDQYQNSGIREAARALAAEGGFSEQTRLNLAKSLLTHDEGRFLEELRKHHKLRIYTFADAAVWLGGKDYVSEEEFAQLLPMLRGLDPIGEQTRPGVALRTVLNEMRGTLPSAVIVISDGITTTNDAERLSTAAEYSRSKGVPIYSIAVGNEEPLRDLALFNTLVDEVAFVDDPITFSTQLDSRGYANKKVDVTLKVNGTDKILARKEVKAGPDGVPVKIELTYTPPTVGEIDFVLEAKPQPKETRLDNNREIRHVTVSKEKIRVLLVDSVPRYEYRYLKHLLEREKKTIEVATVLQDADPEYTSEDEFAEPHFPVKREDLFQYDVLIFGDVNLDYLGKAVQENISAFVNEKGGGILFIAGPRHNPLGYRGTPLEPLIPLELDSVRAPAVDATLSESFQPLLTMEGMKGSSIFRFSDDEGDSIQVWNNLPGMFWMLEAPEIKSGALVFATHPTRTGSSGKLPVILMQRYGGGKIIYHAVDSTWRWRFRVGDLYFGRYWVQAIRYLCRSKLVGKDRTAEMSLDRSVYQRGDPIYIRVRFVDERLAPQADDGVTVVIERQGDAQRRVKLSRLPQAPMVFEGQLPQAPEGAYHAWVATPAFSGAPPSRDFRVESPIREKQKLQMDSADLKRASERTQGKYYTLETVDQVIEDLPQGQSVPLKTDDPIRLWNHWLGMLVCIGLLSAEWILRKRVQLL